MDGYSETPDLRDAFQQQLNSIRASATLKPPSNKDLSFSPTPQAPTDNTPLYLSHAKPGPYKTELDDKQEQQFQQWVSENNIPFKDSDRAGYDMRGYWKALIGGDKRAKPPRNKRFPEQWATPYNGAFSNESVYALPTAPKWVGGKLVTSNGKVLFDESQAKAASEAEPAPESPEAYVQKYAPIYGVDPRLIQAMMGRESGGEQSAVSPKGALGLMQLMPDTARELGVDPTDAEDNVKGGVKYMAQLLARYDGDPRLALAAYHAGTHAVDKAGGIPNTTDGLSTTRDYVDSIMRKYESMSKANQPALAMSPTPAEKEQKSLARPQLPPDPVKYKYTTHTGLMVDETFDRNAFKNELNTIRDTGVQNYIQKKNLQFEPVPGERATESYNPALHPFRFIEFLNETWSNIGSDIDKMLFDQNAKDEAYRDYLVKGSNDPSVPEIERKQFAEEIRDFDIAVKSNAPRFGEGTQPATVVARSLVHDLFDWYSPMMMALRGFNVVGEATSALTGKSGVIARRAFYTANAAVGGKFTYDQTADAMDSFRQGNRGEGFSKLGGAAATGFMTAIGLAMARPKATPEEIRTETVKRLEALRRTLEKSPTFKQAMEASKRGEFRPIFLPDLSREDVQRQIDDLKKRLGRRPVADMRGPLEMEPEPSSLPFTVEDRRGQEKHEGIGVQILDAPVLSPEERMFRRQEQAEQEATQLLQQERARREQDALDKIKRFRDELQEQFEKERELELRDKRRLAPAELVDLRERMEQMANDHMYVNAADMARSLMEEKPRGKALEPFEKDFLRLWEERKRVVRGLSGAAEVRRTRFGEEEARKEAERVDTEQKLRDAAARLSKKATEATTPEESEERSQQAEEAVRRAEEIRTEVDQARAEREAAREKQQTYPAGAPINRYAEGRETQVRLPDGRKLSAKYAVVKLSDLIASHNPDSFAWNDKYEPRRLQPRDYEKNKEARAGVIEGGQNFDLDSFFNTDNTGHNGPPIVLLDGRVAGGNGRAMRLMRAYGKDAEAIRADLVNKAEQFGIDPKSIPLVDEKPVLVRVLDETPTELKDLIELGQDLNRDETRGFSAAEQAVMSGERLSQNTLEWVSRRLDDMGEESSIKDLMRLRGLELAQKLIADGVISPTKRAEFVTGEGELTTKAKDLFENALLGKVINDADLIATMPKHIREKLFRSLAPLSKIKASEPAWDFTDYLEESVRHWKRIDALSETLDAYGKGSRSEQYMNFQNGKMIKEPIHPAVEALIRYLDRKPLEIKDGFYKYIDDYEGRQTTLMGIEPPNPRTSFNINIGEKVGIDVGEGEWGTVRPKPTEPKPEETKKEAQPEPEDDFGELADIPTDQLEADLEQLREIVDNEEDPMLQAYIRELNKRPDRSPDVSAKPAGGTAVAEMEPTPAEREREQEAHAAAEQAVESIRQDVNLATELSTSGPLDEEKLRDILSRHPKYSAGKVSAVISVMKSFTEKYLGMPLNDWLQRNIAQVKVGGQGPTEGLMQRKMDPLPGFEHTVEERKEARAEYEGEQLGLEMLKPKGNISAKAGEIERHGPLFAAANVQGQGDLFIQPTPEEQAKTLEPTPEEPKKPEPQGSLFQAVHGPAMASVEELGRRETFWLVKRNGQLTYQGVSPDANIREGEALIAVKRDGSMRVQQQRMGLSDSQTLERVRPRLNEAMRELKRPEVFFQDNEDLKLLLKQREDIREKLAKAKHGTEQHHYLLARLQQINQSLDELGAKWSYYQANKGAVEFLQDGKAVIHLMENADVSTIFHEFAHVARRQLKAEDRSIVEKWLNVREGQWQVSQEEKFARAFEKYLYDGEAPVPELKSVFARIRDWMLDVYQRVKGSPLDIKVPAEVKQVFDRLVAGGPLTIEAGTTPPSEKALANTTAIGKLREAIRNLPRGVKMPGFAGGETVDFAKENPTQKDLEHYLKLLIEHHVDEEALPFPDQISKQILAAVNPKHIEAIRRERWSNREADSILNAKFFDDPEKMREIAGKVAAYVDGKKYNKLGYGDVMPYPTARRAGRDRLSIDIEREARRLQDVAESKGELVTPAERMGSTKIAEGGEALSESMSDARMRVFPDQEQAIQWAKENRDKLRGIELYTLQDGRGFAHFLPKDPAVLFQEVDPTEIDRRIRLIDERLQKLIPEAERARLGKMRQELMAQKTKQAFGLGPTPEETRKSAGKPLILWTPEGEVEVARETRADTERRALDKTPSSERPGRVEPVSEQAGGPRSSEQDRPAGRGVRGTDKGGRAERAGGESRKALRDVPAAKLDAPVHDRGTELYTKEQWAERTKLLRLPSNLPAPSVRIPNSLRRMLIFPGQAEVAEVVLSGLKQHDAVIIATTTGTGKTYTGSAVLNQLHKPGMKTLIFTTSKDLIHQHGNGWVDVARDFDVDVEELPAGVSFPDEPGAYITTYATGIGREGIETANWDLVVFDEIGEARKWYSSQRGAMAKALATNAKKVIYMSATPFHTALELGHMDKLGLWREQGWGPWSAQFGVYRDAEGNWAGGNAPKKLIKLREQLIERGQYVNVDRNMEGFQTSFAQVPLTPEQVADVRNINEAFKIAEDYFKARKRKSMIRATRANAVTYVKKYLERSRLPQAIEMMKRLDQQGWKAIIFSETKSERSEIFDFLREADEAVGGRISDLLPPLPEVPELLEREFGEQLANYSGPHSSFRTSEKDAFNDDTKKHIYVSYAAGGIGVSLHDTAGNKPRAVIYLGPPYSGVMFDQAIGRAWRYGTKSNVHAIFMTSNARPEIRLILEKVAPRMGSLRALVSGIDDQDKFINTLRSMDKVREGQLAYELGNKVKVDAGDFTETETTHAIQSWKDVSIQSAETAKNKGMRFPEEPAEGPGVIKLFQPGEEYEPPEPPEDFELPADVGARDRNEQLRAAFEEGGPLPAPARAMLADDVESQARADSREGGDPLAGIEMRWDAAKKYVLAAWGSVEGSRPVKAAKVQDLYWMTNGRKVIRDVAADVGAPEVGVRIARMLPEYHVVWGNIAGPWVHRYFEILRENDISTKRKVKFRDPKTWQEKEVNEHHNMVMAKQGKQPPANARIAKAVEQTTKLLNDVRERLAKEDVAVEIHDDGRKRLVPFSQIMDDPHYWPRKYDPNYEIRTTDPETGHVEVTKLKEVLGGELGTGKRERILKHLTKDVGMSLADAEDFLESRIRDVPLVGNVERAREYDLPFYRTDPGAMISYLEGAGEAAARTKIFGQNRQKFEREVTKVTNVKARARIREIMDSVLSKRMFEDETRAYVSLAADWSVLTKMSFSALKAIGHSVHAAMSSNTRAYIRGLIETTTGWKDAHDQAVLSGAILEQYKTEMLREYGSRRRISSRFLDVVGFQGAYEFGRVVADATAREYLQKYALVKLREGKSADYYRRTLKEVYLLDDSTIDQAIVRGWTPEDLDRAGKALSDKTMFTFDPSELPPTWRARSKDPIADNVLAAVRVMTLLKGYMFKTSALLRERIIDEARKGNFRPLIPFAVLYPIMGEVIADLGALFTANRKRYDDLFNNDKESVPVRLLFRFAGDMAHATGLTLVSTLLEAAFRQHNPHYALRDIYEFFAGPFLADAVHTFVQLPMELMSAQTKTRGTTAAEKRYKSLVRWTRSTFPITSPIVNLTKEDKKTPQSHDYRFTPMPTH